MTNEEIAKRHEAEEVKDDLRSDVARVDREMRRATVIEAARCSFTSESIARKAIAAHASIAKHGKHWRLP